MTISVHELFTGPLEATVQGCHGCPFSHVARFRFAGLSIRYVFRCVLSERELNVGRRAPRRAPDWCRLRYKDVSVTLAEGA